MNTCAVFSVRYSVFSASLIASLMVLPEQERLVIPPSRDTQVSFSCRHVLADCSLLESASAIVESPKASFLLPLSSSTLGGATLVSASLMARELSGCGLVFV